MNRNKNNKWDRCLYPFEIGCCIKVYPNDTYFKYGIVVDETEHGIFVEWQKVHPESNYKVEEVSYFPWNNVSFTIVSKLLLHNEL
mgnify:FL=1|jgi:hypothetical protein